MRVLTVTETSFVSGGEVTTTVDDVVVTGQRRIQEAPGFFADLFGFDSGGFSWGDIGLSGGGGNGHVVGQVAGLGIAVPVDENGRTMVGAEIGVDIDPSDGNVVPSVPNGLSYNPSLDPGFNVGPTSVSYWAEVPYTGGGIAQYPVPGGEVGEYYWGTEPGSPLSPFPQR